MDVKEAVAKAKDYLQDVFGGELMSAPRLEEVWFERDVGHWCVTLGFYRKPDDLLSKAAGTFSTYDYKTVRLDRATGQPISIRDPDKAIA